MNTTKEREVKSMKTIILEALKTVGVIIFFVAVMYGILLSLDTPKKVTNQPRKNDTLFFQTAEVVETKGGETTFKTADGNLWGYVMPYELVKGQKVTLTFYDSKTDKREDDEILSVAVDGYNVNNKNVKGNEKYLDFD
jgi:hypothetical protein